MSSVECSLETYPHVFNGQICTQIFKLYRDLIPRRVIYTASRSTHCPKENDSIMKTRSGSRISVHYIPPCSGIKIQTYLTTLPLTRLKNSEPKCGVLGPKSLGTSKTSPPIAIKLENSPNDFLKEEIILATRNKILVVSKADLDLNSWSISPIRARRRREDAVPGLPQIKIEIKTEPCELNSATPMDTKLDIVDGLLRELQPATTMDTTASPERQTNEGSDSYPDKSSTTPLRPFKIQHEHIISPRPISSACQILGYSPAPLTTRGYQQNHIFSPKPHVGGLEWQSTSQAFSQGALHPFSTHVTQSPLITRLYSMILPTADPKNQHQDEDDELMLSENAPPTLATFNPSLALPNSTHEMLNDPIKFLESITPVVSAFDRELSYLMTSFPALNAEAVLENIEGLLANLRKQKAAYELNAEYIKSFDMSEEWKLPFVRSNCSPKELRRHAHTASMDISPKHGQVLLCMDYLQSNTSCAFSSPLRPTLQGTPSANQPFAKAQTPRPLDFAPKEAFLSSKARMPNLPALAFDICEEEIAIIKTLTKSESVQGWRAFARARRCKINLVTPQCNTDSSVNLNADTSRKSKDLGLHWAYFVETPCERGEGIRCLAFLSESDNTATMVLGFCGVHELEVTNAEDYGYDGRRECFLRAQDQKGVKWTFSLRFLMPAETASFMQSVAKEIDSSSSMIHRQSPCAN